MSALGRIFYRLPASQRLYSSFGSGRFFNSSKTPVVAAKSKSDRSDSTPKDSPAAAKTQQKVGSAPDAAPQEPASESTKNSTVSPSPSSSSPPAHLSTQRSYMSSHPTVSSRDFKIHHFFSLHRPLLLISHPLSIFESPPADTPLFRSLASLSDRVDTPDTEKLLQLTDWSTEKMPKGLSVFLNQHVETMMQLQRSIIVARAGATVDWKKTLKVLGIDKSEEPKRDSVREQCDREEVLMDSTKRKRRKKMKKHK